MTRPFISFISAALLAFMPMQSSAQDTERTVTLGQVNLTFYKVVGGLVHELLEQQGYTVEVVEGPHAEIFPKLGRGEVDLFTAAWLPGGHAALYEPVRDQVFEIAPIYENASFFWAVPAYVPEDAVASVADLSDPDVSARMEKRIVSLPEATGLTVSGRRVMEAYGLDAAGYELLAAPPADWLGALQTTIEAGAWAVYPLWQPLWLNAAYDLRVLEEPKGAYGDPDTAYLIGYRDLSDTLDPDMLATLSNIRLEIADVTEMDRMTNVDGLSPREAAKRWMEQNEERVAGWSSR